MAPFSQNNGFKRENRLKKENMTVIILLTLLFVFRENRKINLLRFLDYIYFLPENKYITACFLPLQTSLLWLIAYNYSFYMYYSVVYKFSSVFMFSNMEKVRYENAFLYVQYSTYVISFMIILGRKNKVIREFVIHVFLSILIGVGISYVFKLVPNFNLVQHIYKAGDYIVVVTIMPIIILMFKVVFSPSGIDGRKEIYKIAYVACVAIIIAPITYKLLIGGYMDRRDFELVIKKEERCTEFNFNLLQLEIENNNKCIDKSQ